MALDVDCSICIQVFLCFGLRPLPLGIDLLGFLHLNVDGLLEGDKHLGIVLVFSVQVDQLVLNRRGIVSHLSFNILFDLKKLFQELLAAGIGLGQPPLGVRVVGPHLLLQMLAESLSCSTDPACVQHRGSSSPDRLSQHARSGRWWTRER